MVAIQSAQATSEPTRWLSDPKRSSGSWQEECQNIGRHAEARDQAARLGGPTQRPPIPCIDPDTEPRDRRSKRYKTNANHATWDHISDRLDAVQRPRTLLSWMTAGGGAVSSGPPGFLNAKMVVGEVLGGKTGRVAGVTPPRAGSWAMLPLASHRPERLCNFCSVPASVSREIRNRCFNSALRASEQPRQRLLISEWFYQAIFHVRSLAEAMALVVERLTAVPLDCWHMRSRPDGQASGRTETVVCSVNATAEFHRSWSVAQKEFSRRLALAGLWPVVNIVRSHAEPAVREIIVPRRKAGHDKPCGHLTSRRDQINTNPSCSVPINDAKTGAGKLGSSSLTDRYSRPLLEVFFQAAPNSD